MSRFPAISRHAAAALLMLGAAAASPGTQPVQYSDDFSSSTSSWATRDLGSGLTARYHAGEYQLVITDSDHSINALAPFHTKQDTIDLQVDARLVLPTGADGGVGLTCNRDDLKSPRYIAEITNEGHWVFGRAMTDSAVPDVVSYGSMTVAGSGMTHLELSCADVRTSNGNGTTHVIFTVAGQQLMERDDTWIGVATDGWRGGITADNSFGAGSATRLEADFDNFALRGPKSVSGLAALLVVAFVLFVIGGTVIFMTQRRRAVYRGPQYAGWPSGGGPATPLLAPPPLRDYPVQLSPDRNYWWDGARWVACSMQSPLAAPRSADGRFWWDGVQWRPMTG